MNNEKSLFASERFLQIPPSLAEAIGLNEAIIAQHVYWLQNLPNGGKDFDGHRWVWNTYEDWQKVFPFWSRVTIRRIMRKLEKEKIIIACQPEGSVSRRKYYRISDAAIAHLTHERLDIQRHTHAIKLIASGRDQNDRIE